ncbi:S9 family peptidase [Zhouia spongiae]|uniref:S9 family peptidase n=1 Tax=Zhouia spongiae TaxID=2202721 RepID=A0ABY3YNU2_9FLAO|nr:S9 family peptidase [Zhouia spongiae]UNY99439.1 S9 family peptidase [Zhouia spongiae]
MRTLTSILVLFCTLQSLIGQTEKKPFSYLDVYEIEYASDPQIAPDGKKVVYRRVGFDIMNDRNSGNLWIINADGSSNSKLTSREVSESSPRWSPEGDKIAFISSTDEGAEIYVYWVKTGQYAKLSQLEKSPSSLSWSPDGKYIAFSMNIAEKAPVIAKMPKKPKGAKWADAPRITDRLKHEADGRGYIEPGYNHIFIIPSEGGSPRQLTSGNYNHSGNLSWSPDGKLIYFSGNRNEDWEYNYTNSEVYSVHTETSEIAALTSRQGPDYNPIASPNGKHIAFISNNGKVQAYQNRTLHIMNTDGSDMKEITTELDRSVSDLEWDSKSKGIYFTYDDKGNSKIGYVSLRGSIKKIADNLGGTTVGRPYASGSYTVSDKGIISYTKTTPYHPAEIAVIDGSSDKVITALNSDILPYRNLGKVEEVWYSSSVDNRNLQGWVVYPPNYKKGKKYPLLVENHGGPILNYGDRFSTEMQLYAAEGYLVFYPNPRGSTSYGEEFANLLYNNYPGEDYNDVMDGVDYLINKGLADADNMFVTGGSAGGIMTAWIIGKNNRFNAAVVAKPVINWISKTLVADNYYGYADYRYPGQPWENVEGYWKFSPLSLVANVETPTMVMVGMNDLRTPPSEAKQYYHALKLRKKETVLVEIPGASHNIAGKPSNLITKIAHTLAWFEKYKK